MEGVILERILITAAQMIQCFLELTLLLMKCMKNPGRVVVLAKPIQIFRSAGSGIVVYWLKKKIKICPVHPSIFTLIITFFYKYKTIHMFLNSDFLKTSGLSESQKGWG